MQFDWCGIPLFRTNSWDPSASDEIAYYNVRFLLPRFGRAYIRDGYVLDVDIRMDGYMKVYRSLSEETEDGKIPYVLAWEGYITEIDDVKTAILGGK